ncbi:hypothetical protein NKR23_g2768 [Pleurostoma richardsiae]|uniref:Uncharacterized protein n=1 Tax=Pleurostoma richardsiae TaxID=41990 RepID=A0AA38VXW6_9PEZI|nr:hypothetical protein NKR23_g2768 [Pleurostoma richardsiae]
MRLPFRARIGTPVLDPSAASRIIARQSRLHPRADDDNHHTNKTSIIVAGVVVGVVGLIAMAILIRTLRSRHPNPKYLPTPFLKKLPLMPTTRTPRPAAAPGCARHRTTWRTPWPARRRRPTGRAAPQPTAWTATPRCGAS